MAISGKRYAHYAVALSLFLLSSWLYSQVSGREGQEIRSDIERAQEALQANDPDTAVRELRAALQIDPNNIDARADLGVIAFMHRDYAGAAGDFRAVLRLEPSISKLQALLGMSEEQLGHKETARVWLEKSFPHLQDLKLQIQVGLGLAELDYQVGELAKAASLLNTLRHLDPRNLDVQYAAYRTYAALAENAVDSIALLAPDSARMHLVIAEHLINEGNLSGAIVQYRRVLELDPYLPGVHLELGEALLKDSRTERMRGEAERDFKAELGLNPGDARSECKLGDLYQSNAHLDLNAAYRSYARALQLQPNYADAQIGMGEVLAKMGERQTAIDYLLKASRLDPTNSSAHYRLSQLYRRLGRTTDANRELAFFESLENSKKRIREVYQEMHQLPPGERASASDPAL